MNTCCRGTYPIAHLYLVLHQRLFLFCRCSVLIIFPPSTLAKIGLPNPQSVDVCMATDLTQKPANDVKKRCSMVGQSPQSLSLRIYQRIYFDVSCWINFIILQTLRLLKAARKRYNLYLYRKMRDNTAYYGI